MQVQAQINRIARLSDQSGSYKRLRRAFDVIKRDRDYRAYSDGYDLAVVTKGQQRVIENRVTHQGRMNSINRAASGQSAG